MSFILCLDFRKAFDSVRHSILMQKNAVLDVPDLFCSLAVLDSRVSHTIDVLSPFISVLCHSD